MRMLNLYAEHGSWTQVAALVRNPKGSQPDADAGQVSPLWRIHAGKGEGGKSNIPAKNMSVIKLNMCWCSSDIGLWISWKKEERWPTLSDGNACARDEVVRHWGGDRDKCSGCAQPALQRGWHHDDQGTHISRKHSGLTFVLVLLKLINFWLWFTNRNRNKSTIALESCGD